MIVTQWGLQTRRGVPFIFFFSFFFNTGLYLEFLVLSRSLASSLWEQKTEMARFARSKGPEVH